MADSILIFLCSLVAHALNLWTGIWSYEVFKKLDTCFYISWFSCLLYRGISFKTPPICLSTYFGVFTVYIFCWNFSLTSCNCLTPSWIVLVPLSLSWWYSRPIRLQNLYIGQLNIFSSELCCSFSSPLLWAFLKHFACNETWHQEIDTPPFISSSYPFNCEWFLALWLWYRRGTFLSIQVMFITLLGVIVWGSGVLHNFMGHPPFHWPALKSFAGYLCLCTQYLSGNYSSSAIC